MSLDGRVGYDEVLNQAYSDREKSLSSGGASVSMTLTSRHHYGESPNIMDARQETGTEGPHGLEDRAWADDDRDGGHVRRHPSPHKLGACAEGVTVARST